MKTVFKIIILATLMSMVLGLVGCGEKESDVKESAASDVETTAAVEQTTEATEATDSEVSETATDEVFTYE